VTTERLSHGPWTVEPYPNGDGEQEWTEYAINGPIGPICSFVMTERIARLIAAAPELLAALKALKDHVAGEAMFVKGSDGAAWQPVDEPLASLLEAAEVAISKGEGREP
jgi:hypothetical protein